MERLPWAFTDGGGRGRITQWTVVPLTTEGWSDARGVPGSPSTRPSATVEDWTVCRPVSVRGLLGVETNSGLCVEEQ